MPSNLQIETLQRAYQNAQNLGANDGHITMELYAGWQVDYDLEDVGNSLITG